MSIETAASPAALPPPPRSVRRRPRTSGLAAWTTLVLIPFAVVGIAMLITIPFHLAFLPKPGVVIIFDLLIAVFLWFVRIPMMQEKNLVRTGALVAGTVLDSAAYRGKTTMYTVTFTFKSADGTEMRKKAVVSATAFGKVSAGQPVMVLFDPAHPESAVIYECCAYEAV